MSSKNERRSPKFSGLSLEEALRILLSPPAEVLFSDYLVWPDMPRYQKDGAAFLYQNAAAILADEMGLGKTVQAVAAMRLLACRGELSRGGRILLVMPRSIFSQWKKEIAIWAPELAESIVVISGNKERRRRLWASVRHNAVVFVGYETLRTDYDDVDKGRAPALHEGWGLVLLDEAQRIKNPKAEVSREAKALLADRRWALTGTPLENRPEDMYSILEFVRGAPARAGAGEDELLEEFHRSCRRRKISDVGLDLPPKIVKAVEIEMDEEQARDYEAAEGRAQATIEEYEGNDRALRFHAQILMLKLMQACNSAASAPYRSAKAFRLIEQLEEAVANDKKSLVFSKWVQPPFGVERLAEDIGREHPEWGVRQLTGKMTPAQRERAVHDFQNDPAVSVLLMTLGSGGVGLNLQKASYVFHYDRAWNPAVEAQAEGRAHRRGQTGQVIVYQYITGGTIEERIDEVLRNKAEMFKNYVDLPAEDAAREMANRLSISDIRRLFKMERRAEQGRPGDPDWKRLEARCERLLRAQGYRAERTPEGADGGIDVIGRKTEPESLVLLQAKNYTSSIGVEELRAFAGAAADHAEAADRLIFAAPSGFSAEARSFALRHSPEIELWGENELAG